VIPPVLGPGPISYRPPRHLPEAVYNLVTQHSGDLSGPLAGDPAQPRA
jgi:hypothetical protein